MWLQPVFSSVLFLLPVLITVGLYLGIDSSRIATCGLHCMQTGHSPYGLDPGNRGNSTNVIYCQKSYAISPAPGRYTFNPNQWGDVNNTGNLCLEFTTSGMGRPTDYAPGFAITWRYPISPNPTLPVHAFPNAQLEIPDTFPVKLNTMQELNLDVTWTYGPGNTLAKSVDYPGIIDAEVNANVCVDMFLSPKPADAGDTTVAHYEVMVWLGRFGPATDPVGYLDGLLTKREVSGVTFSLYGGVNSLGQHTLTWLADRNMTTFTGSIAPLLQNLSPYNGPASGDYLGYMAFGSETLNSQGNTTFYVPKLDMDVVTS